LRTVPWERSPDPGSKKKKSERNSPTPEPWVQKGGRNSGWEKQSIRKGGGTCRNGVRKIKAHKKNLVVQKKKGCGQPHCERKGGVKNGKIRTGEGDSCFWGGKHAVDGGTYGEGGRGVRHARAASGVPQKRKRRKALRERKLVSKGKNRPDCKEKRKGGNHGEKNPFPKT